MTDLPVTCPPKFLHRPSKSRVMRLAWCCAREASVREGLPALNSLPFWMRVEWADEKRRIDRMNKAQERVWAEGRAIIAEIRAAGPSPVFLRASSSW